MYLYIWKSPETSLMLLRMYYSLNFLVVLRFFNRPVLVIKKKKITMNMTCIRQKNDSASGHSNAILSNIKSLI